ncbi:MAG: LPS-assembly lipoprotein LptE [Gammaproteobacteria bacterium]
MKRIRPLRALLLGALVLELAGCGGWKLRGTGDDSAVGYKVFLKTSGARTVGPAVRREVINRGARIVTDRADADLVLEVMGQRFDRRILSVDPDTGKVREIELSLESAFSIRRGDGTLVVPRETLSWQVDYIFDENSVLGTTAQDRIVQRDLADVAATAMVLRLSAIDLSPSP